MYCAFSEIESEGARAFIFRSALGEPGEKIISLRMSANVMHYVNLSVDVAELSCLFWNTNENSWGGEGCAVSCVTSLRMCGELCV